MNAIARLTISAGVLVALCTSINYAGPSWSTGPSVESWLGLPQQVQKNLQFAQALEEQSARVRQRIRAQNEVIKEILDRKMSLLEAACRFRAASMPLVGARLRCFQEAYPGASESERFCRQVIAFTRWHAICPEQSRRRAGELEAELSWLQRDEGVMGTALPVQVTP
jgi:hypothetical protein